LPDKHITLTPDSSSDHTAKGLPKVVLVGVDLGQSGSFDPTLDELALLAESAGDLPVEKIIARRKAPMK
jgi:GTPase